MIEKKSRSSATKVIPVVLSSIFGLSATFAADTIVVNEPGGVGLSQSGASLIGTSNGGLLLFRDTRTGMYEYRLRALDANGTPTYASVPLESQLSPTLDMSSVSIDSNPSTGSTVALWRLSGAEGRQLVRIDPETGEVIGTSMTILDDEEELANTNTKETVRVADDGVILVLFRTNDGIRGRLYGENFDSLGPSFQIGEDFESGPMTAGFHADGSFTAAWIGHLPPYFNSVRGQRFNADGSSAGPVYNYTDAEIFMSKRPALCAEADGSGMIAWLGEDDLGSDGIYGQRFDNEGIPQGVASLLVGEESLISEPVLLERKSNGNWILLQEDSGTASISEFETGTLALASEDLVHDMAYSTGAWHHSSEAMLLAWTPVSYSPNNDILGAVFWTDGSGHSDVMVISDDVDGAQQSDVEVASNSHGESVLIWEDWRFGDSRIFMQRFDADGNAVGANVDVTGAQNWIGYRDVAMNDSGEVVVIWDVSVGTEGTIMAQRYAANGAPLGAPINVNGGTVDKDWGRISLGIYDDGGFIVAWPNSVTLPWPGNSETNVHIRAFDADGSPRTVSAPMLNGASNSIRDHESFEVITRSDGSALVFYENNYGDPNGSGSDYLRVREIAPTGNPFGPERTLATTDSSFWHISAAGNDERYAIAYSFGFDSPLTVALFNDNGSLLADDAITSVDGDIGDGSLAWASDDSFYLVYEDSYWTGTSWFDNMRYQQYDANGTPMGDSVAMIHLDDRVHYLEAKRAMVAGDSLCLAYVSATSNEQGNDIFLTRVDISGCASSDFNCDGHVDGFDLSLLLGFWGQDEADLNGDGTTDGADLAMLLGDWTG